MGFNFGQPATGGVKLDGTPATDAWGTASASSTLAFEMWTNPDLATDKLYGRKFDYGYAVMYMRPTYLSAYRTGKGYRSFTFPFTFRPLNVDGTLGTSTDTISLSWGEGAILITDDVAVTTTTTTPPVTTVTTVPTTTVTTAPPETWTTTSGTTTVTTSTTVSTTSTTVSTTSTTTLTTSPRQFKGPGLRLAYRPMGPDVIPRNTSCDLKYQIFEAEGGAFAISAVTWALRAAATGTSALSGTGYFDNADLAQDGTAIQTVQIPVDLTPSVAAGDYWLAISITLSTGRTWGFRVRIKVEDYEGIE